VKKDSHLKRKTVKKGFKKVFSNGFLGYMPSLHGPGESYSGVPLLTTPGCNVSSFAMGAAAA
jgi:hypothetical protein